MRLGPRRTYRKIFLSFAAFVGLAIAAALIWRNFPPSQERSPSSVLYNDDDELVMEEVTLGVSTSKLANDVKSQVSHFVLTPGTPRQVLYDRKEIAKLIGGDNGLRARKVVFHRDAFVRAIRTPERAMQFTLFENVSLSVRFAPSSAFASNAGLYSGTIDGEASGSVRFFVLGDVVHGTFETNSKIFRLIDAGDGQHFAVEERVGN